MSIKIHYTNPNKPGRTICGHNSTIPGRTYSNITTDINKVNCRACQNAIKLRKYLKHTSKSSVPEIAQKQPAGAFEPLSRLDPKCTEQKTKLGAGDNLLEGD